MRTIDAVMAVPGLLLALLVVSTLGKGSLNAAIAIAVAFAPGMARITRSVALAVRRQDYVAAAIARGESGAWIVFARNAAERRGTGGDRNDHPRRLRGDAVRHAELPRSRRAAAGVGLGADDRRGAPFPASGAMDDRSRRAPRSLLTAIGFNLLGDGLRDALNPRDER